MDKGAAELASIGKRGCHFAGRRVAEAKIIRPALIIPVTAAAVAPSDPLEAPKFSAEDNGRGLDEVEIDGSRLTDERMSIGRDRTAALFREPLLRIRRRRVI